MSLCCCLVLLNFVWLFLNPMNYSLPGSSVLGISQARILEQVAISSSRGSFWIRDQTHVSCIGRQILYHCAKELMLLNCGVGKDSREPLGLQGDPTSPSWRRSVLNIHWKVWCWSWNFDTLASWCEELTLWKRPWCLERLRAGGEEDDRGWDGWKASPTQWTEQALRVGDGQGSLACCSPWDCKESDMTEQLNWLNWTDKCHYTFVQIQRLHKSKGEP